MELLGEPLMARLIYSVRANFGPLVFSNEKAPVLDPGSESRPIYKQAIIQE